MMEELRVLNNDLFTIVKFQHIPSNSLIVFELLPISNLQEIALINIYININLTKGQNSGKNKAITVFQFSCTPSSFKFDKILSYNVRVTYTRNCKHWDS